jgi:hypothetical protein
MILCPNCKHHETSGALFCSECGIPINEVSDDSTQTAKYSQENSKTIENFRQTAFPPSHFDSIEGLSLFLINNEKIIDLAGKNEYTIGRATDDQPVVPDVDLTPFGAYDFGVSRLHATITVGDPITITDMGSINGTQLNGREIQPHASNPLFHGDVLTLGKMKIQVLIKS